MIKAIFFDVDGTLLSFRTHRVPESAVQALQTLHRRGIRLFVASGRRKADIDRAGLPDVFDGYVTLNGGYCLLADGTEVFRRFIPRPDIETLIELQDTPEAFPCVLVNDERLLLNFQDEQVERLARQLDLPIPGAAAPEKWVQAARSGISQMLWFFPEDRQPLVMARFPGCRIHRWSPLFGDVVPAGVGKDGGIERMAAYLGIRMEETMAFGDGGNDIPMLQAAGTSVAMGDAAPSVKQAADFVTSSVDKDGIVLALEHFGLL